MNPKKKRDKRKWLAVNLILLFIFALFTYLNARVYLESQALNKEKKSWEKKLEQARWEKEQLLSEISFLKTKRFLEGVARDDFDLKKPGEKVVVFKISQNPENDQKKEKIEKKRNLLQEILKKLQN